MTPIEQARLRMPPALPMDLAPRDGTPVLVCDDILHGDTPWVIAYCLDAKYGWYTESDPDKELDSIPLSNPLGWFPLPEVLTAPVEEMPAPPTPERHKPLPYPEDK